MYFVAFATDFDGTLAEDGRVDPPTLQALELLRESGRKLILVTGRELPDLRRVSPKSGGSTWWSPKTARFCTSPRAKRRWRWAQSRRPLLSSG